MLYSVQRVGRSLGSARGSLRALSAPLEVFHSLWLPAPAAPSSPLPSFSPPAALPARSSTSVWPPSPPRTSPPCATRCTHFTDVYALVEQNYADKLNNDKIDKAIYDGAIPGMLHVLDPHSNFYDPKAFAQMREDQHGKYYGVGMTIQPQPSNEDRAMSSCAV